MLYEFLNHQRAELIGRCRAKVARRAAPKATPAELEYGVPLFLDQLVATLKAEQASPQRRVELAGSVQPARQGPEKGRSDAIGATAKQHGRELLKQGYTVDQVVHGYGDLCQAITGLATELGTTIETDEFQTLNRCLDDAIAGAVTEFSARRETVLEGKNIQVSDERARVLLHELQTHLQTATHAITAVKAGNVGLKGATGAVLDLALICMRTLIDRSLAATAVTGGVLARH